MAKGLTQRQQEIVDFLNEYIREEGYPPSIREIGERFDIASLRGVTVHLEALERKGYIERNNTPRSIRIIHPDYKTLDEVVLLPLIGEIAAGIPITAQQNVEDRIAVPSQMVKGANDPYLLRVKGDSMIGDGILPRDLVVIRPQPTAHNNELVAVMVEDEATVKRVQFLKEGIRLIASNPAYDPIEVSPNQQFKVLGKVVGLIRDYDGRAF